MFSDLFLPTFPYLDLPLYEELKLRGIEVVYVLQAGDVRLITPSLSPAYLPITATIKKPKHIASLLTVDDLFVCRFGYKGDIQEAIDAIRSKKCRILALDPAAVDVSFRQCQSTYLTSKSPWMTEQINKEFPGAYQKIFTTGTMHFDEAWRVKVDKETFMRSYGFDPKKRLAILCKSSAGEIGHQKGVDDEYKQIAEIVRKCSDYELLFKCHPIDHHSQYPLAAGIFRKNEHYGQKPSWELLFPEGIRVLKPEEGYMGFKCADVILNVRSSVGMESMLFPTPLININSHKYSTNWPKVNEAGIMKNIELKDLEKVLKNNEYGVNKDKCLEHVKRYCDPVADGRAYARIADVIAGLI